MDGNPTSERPERNYIVKGTSSFQPHAPPFCLPIDRFRNKSDNMLPGNRRISNPVARPAQTREVIHPFRIVRNPTKFESAALPNRVCGLTVENLARHGALLPWAMLDCTRPGLSRPRVVKDMRGGRGRRLGSTGAESACLSARAHYDVGRRGSTAVEGVDSGRPGASRIWLAGRHPSALTGGAGSCRGSSGPPWRGAAWRS